jgi:hypothetical protein
LIDVCRDLCSGRRFATGEREPPTPAIENPLLEARFRPVTEVETQLPAK